MRRAAKVDRNQSEIVEALRKCGADVISIAAVGNGKPDIIVGFRGQNYLMEIKVPGKRKKAIASSQLNQDQVEFHTVWPGNVCVVRTVKDAMEAVGL